MENQKPRPEEIANAISTVADAVLKLHTAGLIEQSNITKANLLLSTVLDKALEGATKCWVIDCGSNDNNDYTEPTTIEEWAANLNFTADLQNNLSLWAGMDIMGWQGALEAYYLIIGQPEVYTQLIIDAKATPDYNSAVYNYGINLITQLMTQSK